MDWQRDFQSLPDCKPQSDRANQRGRPGDWECFAPGMQRTELYTSSFQDYLYIPTATSRTLVTTTSTPVPVCLPHQPKTCIQSLVPLNLAPRPSFNILGNPFGKNAVLNGVGDSLVLAGIAVAAGTAVYYLKKD